MLKRHHKIKNCEDSLRNVNQLKNVCNIVITDDFIEFDTWVMINYSDLVVKLIRKKYTINDELAILRKHDSEFDTYNEFAESCKSEARQMIQERINAIGK